MTSVLSPSPFRVFTSFKAFNSQCALLYVLHVSWLGFLAYWITWTCSSQISRFLAILSSRVPSALLSRLLWRARAAKWASPGCRLLPSLLPSWLHSGWLPRCVHVHWCSSAARDPSRRCGHCLHKLSEGLLRLLYLYLMGFPGAQMVKNPPAMQEENTGNSGLIPGCGRAPAEGNGNPLQYPCLEHPMDRDA